MVYKFITRTKGVVIFAISLIAFGSFATFLVTLSILLLPLNGPGFEENAAMDGMLSMPVFWISSVISLLIYIAWVIAGIGALHLKEWARHLLRISMGAYIINMLVNIVLNVFAAEEILTKIPMYFLIAGIVISFAYYLSVIYFFSHPNIVRQFKYKSREY
ncbi:MAG: hypothetical protein HZB36_01185 [Candidatus Omnitrophica bacterium]|nr:hypothetical protein [Candidatus Omnitrophota bacterium]